MVNVEKVAEKVFGILKGLGYQIKMYSAEGNETVDPAESRRFYSIDPTVMITVDEENNTLQLNKSVVLSLDDVSTLLHSLRDLANKNLMNYSVRDYGKQIEPRDFAYQAKILRNKHMEKVDEGLSKLTGSKRVSYQTCEDVRIVVRHKQPIDENIRGSRSRGIQTIFLEHNDERFRFPYNSLNGARAMARHLSEGGTMSDKIGSYIIESLDRLTKLVEFLRYVNTNKLINEETETTVGTLRENVSMIKSELKRFTGKHTYESIKTRILEQGEVVIEENDLDSLRDSFTVKRFDEKYVDVLPIVNRIVQEKNLFLRRIEESSKNPIKISPNGTTSSAILEFASEHAMIGHKLSDLANRIQENDELSHYILDISNKICKEGEISSFEKEIVRNVIENCMMTSKKKKSGQLKECRQYSNYFNRYKYLFV